MIILQIEGDQLSELIQTAIRKVLAENPNLASTPVQDLMTIREASEYLHLSIGAIYAMVHRRAICYSKRGKRLFFSKKELSAWVETGRKPTAEEIRLSAREQLHNKQ
jgi:excisionase family DNA binding protein